MNKFHYTRVYAPVYDAYEAPEGIMQPLTNLPFLFQYLLFSTIWKMETFYHTDVRESLNMPTSHGKWGKYH